MRLLPFLLASIAGCGITAESGQFTCPDGRCPSGLVCVAELCVTPGTPGVDAGPRDAPVPDVPGLDAPEVPIDAGPPESCAPSSDGAAVDEDLDGAIDEGCTLAYGPHHPVLPAMPIRDVGYVGFEVTDDGLTGVFVELSLTINRPIRRLTRPNILAPFDTLSALTGTAIAGVAPLTVTVDGAGTQLIIGGIDDLGELHLYSVRGDVATSTFSSTALVSELEDVGSGQAFPSLSRDGLELIFTDATLGTLPSAVLYHTRRSTRMGVWEPPTMIGDGAYGTLSADGRTLYFVDLATERMGLVRRASRDDPFPDTATGALWAPFGAERAVIHPFFVPRTRELFFAYNSIDESAPVNDVPGDNGSTFRAEVCANGACVPELVACADGTRSADGFHCYTPPPTTSGSFTGAMGACSGRGHLPTIHSLAEDTMVRREAGGTPWLGLIGPGWVTGEPLLYAAWTGAEPTTAAQCTLGDTADWTLADCVTTTASVLCESEIWPTWVSP